MKKLLTVAIIGLALLAPVSKAHAYYHTPVVVMGESTGFAALPFLTTVAFMAVIPLNVYGVDPWHPVATYVWGDKGVVEYSYPKGRNGA